MSEHTPGPWSTDGVVVWANEDGGQRFDVPVCVMTSRHENELTHPATNAPTCGLENADLISAAPDLLAALKQLRDDTVQVYKLGRIPAIGFLLASNAIAKAEGK